jgi:hypothetical protein
MKKERNCPVCGDPVVGEAWRIWCSDRCRSQRHVARDAAAKAPEPERPTPPVPAPAKKAAAARPAPAPPPPPPPGTSKRPACAGPGCAKLAKPRGRSGPPPAYCSRTCQNRAYIARKAGKAPEQRPAPAPAPRAPDPPPAPPVSAHPAVGPARSELVALARAAVAWGRAVLAAEGADA